jgi:hypothetical protein
MTNHGVVLDQLSDSGKHRLEGFQLLGRCTTRSLGLYLEDQVLGGRQEFMQGQIEQPDDDGLPTHR